MNAPGIVTRLLEDDAPEGDADLDAFFKRALAELPERNVGLRSPTAPGDGMTAPMRVVLNKSHNWQPGSEEWVTHLENMQVGGRFWGHYCCGYAEALADYRARCAKLGVDAEKSMIVDAD